MKDYDKLYKEAVEYMYNSLPMFQRTGKAAYKANLDNTHALDKHFNYPHTYFKSIHVGGTNGKGSTSHMIASIFQEQGLRVGLYTSPHLKDFRERIKINGQQIPDYYVVDFINDNKKVFEELKPSFFEMTVFLAFNYFKEAEVDIAIIEVGLGGRLDSTNVIKPLASVITNISYDHTNLLGNTLQQIATEKAGIIKNDTSVIIGQTQDEVKDIFIDKANKNESEIFFADENYKTVDVIQEKNHVEYTIGYNNKTSKYKCGLKGAYQEHNLKTVLQLFNSTNKDGLTYTNSTEIKKGLKNVVKNTGILGRWQLLSDSPRTICDTGHNVAGIMEILSQLKNESFNKLHFVLGMVNDKNIDGVLKLLPKDAAYYFTKANIPRSLCEKELQKKASEFGLKGKCNPVVSEALSEAQNAASDDDIVFVGGSTFVVAEVV